MVFSEPSSSVSSSPWTGDESSSLRTFTCGDSNTEAELATNEETIVFVEFVLAGIWFISALEDLDDNNRPFEGALVDEDDEDGEDIASATRFRVVVG
mmetsp:Transcript_2700/g.4540  ORF Transcript_2700/g.4540 Transcript_2700/m.4540 type:complete len:97 (-) Transcript_2700:5-295(-)